MPPLAGKILRALLLPLLLAAGILLYLEYGHHLNTDAIREQGALLQQYYAQQPLATLLLFTLFVILYIGAAIPGGQVAPIAAGFFFGYLIGVLTSVVFYAAGTALTFLLARYCLGAPLQRRFADKLADFNRGVERDGVWYLFIIRQLPLPFFAVNLCMGLTSVRLPKYVWANALALLPNSLTGPFLGTVLSDVERSRDLLSPEFFAAVTLVSLIPPVAAKLIINAIRARRQRRQAAGGDKIQSI